MAQAAATDYDELRGRVRAAQHVRSFPLLVIGALLVNYGVSSFAAQPVQWRYGAPLAFVLVWALGKANEASTGIGAGRADYLVAAGFVFAATNLVLLRPQVNTSLTFGEIEGIWVVIVGLALAAIARAARDGLLAAAAITIFAAGVVVAIDGRVTDFGFLVVSGGSPEQTWPNVLVAVVGAVLAVTGLLLYRRERVDG
jgi:hypothetical protein